MAHHTKQKGDLAVLKVKADLVEKGFFVGSLDTEHAPFDIFAYKDYQIKRIQVKYRSLKKGAISVNFKTSWADKNGSHVNFVDKNHIDIYGIFCPETNKCYYLNPKNFNKYVALRVETAKNNQTAAINYADNYLNIE